jgi:GDP-D-mannose dehydratase
MYILVNFIRSLEVDFLVGDSTNSFTGLGCKSKLELNKLIEIMIENDIRLEQTRN